MKRSLQLLGLFLPFLDTSASLHLQYNVKPSKRKVKYSESNIPSPPEEKHRQTESKTNNILYSLKTYDDDGWYIHVDAMNEHPDEILSQVLRRNTNKPKKGSFWGYDDYQFNNDLRHIDLHVRLLSDNVSESPSSFVYDVSIETEQNVTYDSEAPSEVDSNTNITTSTITYNDSSTVLIISTNSTIEDVGSNSTNDDEIQTNATLTNKKSFRPLRFRTFLSNIEGGGTHLTYYQRTTLLQDIIKPALLSWSMALRVQPVVGNLTVDPNQLVDGKLCGPGGDLPSFLVPVEHTTIGVPDTDFILYIHLAFNWSKTNNTDNTGGDVEDSYNATETGKYNASFGENISSSNKKQCTGDYLAASTFCSTDQFDRPTAAILHICIGDNFFLRSELKSNIRVTRHELGHVLGFNAVSLAHFRRPNGLPYTDRDPITGAVPITEINCTGPISANQTGEVALPSEEVLQFRIVREGVRVAEIVTPTVRQVVRNHFDCQHLPGAELESGEILPLSTYPGETSCIGDHWERRLFKTDLMNPLLDESVEFSTRFSTVTLAYFADSGWYQVDLSRATVSSGWGRASGCKFVEETCVNTGDGQVSSSFDSYFCNQIPEEMDEPGYASEIHGCTTDLTRKAVCSVDSSDAFMDFCPVYAGFLNGLCSDSENEALIKVNYIERFGQKNSRCLSGRVTNPNTYHSESGQNESGFSSTNIVESTALCLNIACVVEDRTLRIQVNGVWMVCKYKDEVLIADSSSTLLTSSDKLINVTSVVCPDPIRVCPTFYCYRDCIGTNRICDYNVGKCVCGRSVTGNLSNSDFAGWDGKSFTNSNETNVVTCTTPSTAEDINGTSTDSQSFYDPEQYDDEDEFPSEDSPLSDYYFKTERNLKENSSNGFWSRKRIVLVSSGGLFLVLALTSVVVRVAVVNHDNTVAADRDNGDIRPPSDEMVNPNKDKLMASFVVHLRMNNLQQLRRNDPLSNRDSETDTSMTDFDAASERNNSLDMSLEFGGGTIVDLAAHDNATTTVSNTGGGLYDDVDIVYVDPLSQGSTRLDVKPIVRRRRHLFSQFQ